MTGSTWAWRSPILPAIACIICPASTTVWTCTYAWYQSIIMIFTNIVQLTTARCSAVCKRSFSSSRQILSHDNPLVSPLPNASYALFHTSIIPRGFILWTCAPSLGLLGWIFVLNCYRAFQNQAHHRHLEAGEDYLRSERFAMLRKSSQSLRLKEV